MEQKAKIIIMGLGVFLAISIFIALQAYTTKEQVRRERDDAKVQTETINQKFSMLAQEAQKLKERIEVMTGDLNKLTQEKDQIRAQSEELAQQKNAIQSRYETIAKERDELVGKLKAQPVAEEKKEAPVVTDAYWAGVLKEKMKLAMVVENMRSELSALKIKNDQLGRDSGSLNRERDELEQQFNYNQKMFDSMASELVLERNAKRMLQESSKTLKNENMLLRRQLKGLSSKQAELEDKFMKLQREKVDIDRRFNEMADVLEDRLSKVSEIKQQLAAVRSGSGGEINIAQPAKEEVRESVELPPIFVRPQSEKITPQEAISASGRVLEINKENNFVIIDAGEESGVKTGDTFQVYNMEGRAVATIEAIQVRTKITACDIKKETTPIIVGDTVR